MSRFLCIAFIGALCSGHCLAQGQQAVDLDLTRRFTWARATSGLWTNPGLWGEAGFPSSPSDSALIGVDGTYRIELDDNFDIADLTIPNPDATLAFIEGGGLELGTALRHEGLLEINPDGSPLTSALAFDTDGEIWGNGHIELGALVSRNDARIWANNHTLMIAPGISIAGAGEIWGNLINHAHIIAHSDNATPLLIAGDVIQSGAGMLEGIDSPLEFTGTVQGGLVRMQPDSTLVFYELADLSQTQLDMGPEVTVRISGNRAFPPYLYDREIHRVEIVYGCDVSFDRSFDINGEYVLSAQTQSFSNGSRLSFDGGDITIGGEGAIRMLQPGSSSSTNYVGTDEATSLTFGPGITIEGEGVLYTNEQTSQIEINGVVRTLSEEDTISIRGNTTGGTFLAQRGSIMLGGDENVITDACIEASEGGSITVFGRTELVNIELLNGTPLKFFVNAVATIGGTFSTTGPIELEQTEASIIFDDPILFGSSELNITRNRAERNNGFSGTLTLPPTYSIRGSGRMDMVLTNYSSVTADDPVLPMQMHGTNTYGLYESRDGGVMEVRADFIDAEIVAGDGGVIELQNADFRDSWVHQRPGGLVTLGESAQIDIRDSIVQIDMNQFDQSNVALFGSTRLDGQHTLEDQSQLRLLTSDLTGQGTIRLIDDPKFGWRPEISSSYVNSGFGPGYDIVGSGLIRGPMNGPLIVEGALIADDPLAPLRLNGVIGPVSSMLATEGYFLLEDGAELRSSTLESSGDGYYTSADEGVVHLRDIENRSTLILAGESVAEIEGDLINNGLLVIGSGEERRGAVVTMPLSTSLVGSGELELRPGSTETATLICDTGMSLGAQQRLTGAGLLDGEFSIDGVISPDQGEGGLIARDLIMSPEASLELRIASDADPASPWLTSIMDGRLTFSGTLQVVFDDGHTPLLGDRWLIATGPSLEGRFDRIESSGLSDGRALIVVDSGQGPELVYTCPGDRNGDTSRDFFDVTDFLMSFQAGNPSADLNLDGQFNFLDVSAFITLYTSDCPSQ